MKKTFKVILSLILMIAFAITSVGLTKIPVKSIKLDNNKITMTVGKTAKLNVVITPANASDKKLLYTTSNKRIATIDKDGKITAVKAGKAVIYVKCSSNTKISAKCNITVSQASSQTVNLTWYTIGSPQKDIDSVLAEANKIIKAKINATLSRTIIDWGNYNDKIKVIMASGDPFDICFTSSWANDYYACIAKGGIIPLDDLLDQYGKDIKAAIPAKYWDAARVKGKIYGVLNYQIFASNKGFEVKKEFLDKYKFDYTKVKKYEDMEPLLQLVKLNEPGVTPLVLELADLGICPLHNLETGYTMDSVKGSFSSPFYIRTDNVDYKVFNVYETKEVMDFFKLMRSWYLKGYIRKDAATIKDWRTDFGAGKYAAVLNAGNLKPGNEAEMSRGAGFDIVDIPTIVPFVNTGGIIATMNGISRTSRNPERAMLLLNLLYSDKDLYNMMVFGVEGKHYKKIDADFVEPIADSGYTGMAWELGSQFNAYYTKGQAKGIWEETIKVNEEAAPSPLLGFSYNSEPTKTENAQIDTVLAEYVPGLSTGTLDPEKKVPEFLDKLKKAGIDKVIVDMQGQIDQWRIDNNK